MNNQIKILLSIQGIAGRTLRPLGKKKVKWTITKKDVDPKYTGKDAMKPLRKGHFYMSEFEEVPVQQSIKMSYDAYDYFTKGECPEWFRGPWGTMTKKQRLEVHLKRICEDRGGTSFTYSILED